MAINLITAQVIISVILIAAGQIMFKITARSWSQYGSLYSIKPALSLFCAMILYATATIIWIRALRDIDLSRAYPYMSLSFVLVPISRDRKSVV